MNKPDKRLHVLLVDDNPHVLKSLGMIFKALGWESAQAEDAEQALLQLEQQRFDLAILDLRMPGMDGISLCKIIRSNHKHKDTVIFIHSGYVDNHMQAEAEKSGANAVLYKPMGLDEIKSHLIRVGLEKTD